MGFKDGIFLIYSGVCRDRANTLIGNATIKAIVSPYLDLKQSVVGSFGGQTSTGATPYSVTTGLMQESCDERGLY